MISPVRCRDSYNVAVSAAEANRCLLRERVRPSSVYNDAATGGDTSLAKIIVVKTQGSTLASTATQTKNALAVMQIPSYGQSMSTLGTPSTNGPSATYVNSAPLCKVCSEKSHCQAQYPFLPGHLRNQFATHRKTIWRIWH